MNMRTRPSVKEASATGGAGNNVRIEPRAPLLQNPAESRRLFRLFVCASPAFPATLTVPAPTRSRMSASVRGVVGECSVLPSMSPESRVQRSSSSSEQRAHTHTGPTQTTAMVMMKQPPARMRTTPTESECKHVRDSIETLRGATPTFISVTGTFYNQFITATTLKVK